MADRDASTVSTGLKASGKFNSSSAKTVTHKYGTSGSSTSRSGSTNNGKTITVGNSSIKTTINTSGRSASGNFNTSSKNASNNVSGNMSTIKRNTNSSTISTSNRSSTTNTVKSGSGKYKNISKIAETSYNGDANFDEGVSGTVINDLDGLFASNLNSEDTSKGMGQTYTDSDLYKLALHGSNLFQKDEIDIYNYIYRFGLFNPYGTVTNLREYLFFTKPDLNIYARDDITGQLKQSSTTGGYELATGLAETTYWNDLITERPNTIKMLQNSYAPGWNMLLQNQVISNLEIPSLEGTAVESPINNYGVGFQYRGTSEASDDSIDFALEFKDTKWLDVYTFFKAYDEYEVLKHHGVVAPWQGYIVNRNLHDQFAIYKIMVGDDMETIVYWCKLYGVMPMNLPRDVFSTADFSNGLSYTINFKAAFFEDMRKDILVDFNNLSMQFDQDNISGTKYQYETYNTQTGMGDFRPAKHAYVERYRRDDAPGGFVYKLKWKGDKEF